jgi:hypothetical protein
MRVVAAAVPRLGVLEELASSIATDVVRWQALPRLLQGSIP